MHIDFALTLFLKETQLQHGLRVEDYARYHHYITNRLATLRRQLKLSNDRKKFLHKEVTVHNARDARHLMLLALYAERCWASAESMQEKCLARKEASGDSKKSAGGIPPSDQYRKRLNKMTKWTAKLQHIVQTVGSEGLQIECAAYHHECSARAAISHGNMGNAKECFLAAREAYYQLRATCSEEQWDVILLKVNELDDRIHYCMQRLGEDPSTYTPTMDANYMKGSTTIEWNGRLLNVAGIKVKDALREARSVPVESVQAKVLESVGPIAVGQTNKVLDAMDRRINYYNDALAHARQDLRSEYEGSLKTEQQLLVHYLLFHVSQETLQRSLFLAEVFSRRFWATERTLRASSSSLTHNRNRKSEVAPAQFASPLEVVRLYEAAMDAVAEMELLPGVSDRDDIEALRTVCRAGKLLYIGESWRVKGDAALATSCCRAARNLLNDVQTPLAQDLRERAERSSLQLVALGTLSNLLQHIESDRPVPYLNEASCETVSVAQNVIRFPPDYQGVASKPAFVDIAFTYVDYTSESTQGEMDASSPGDRPSQQSKTSARGADAQLPEKKWGWKWGWGK